MDQSREQHKNETMLMHQFEEWKLLNEYVNKVESDYTQMLVVVISVFGLITAFFSSKQSDLGIMKYAIYIVPAGLTAV